MTSFTFSFRKTILLIYLTLAIIVVLILTQLSDDQLNSTIANPGFFDAHRQTINEVDPDMILIGNSLLYSNIHTSILEKRLSEKTKRKTRVTIIGAGGTHSPWIYLVLKNQVATSNARGIPVGIFYQGYTLTSPFYGTEL